MEFINETHISSLINNSKLNNTKLQQEAIQKAKDAKGLTLEESAALLNITDLEISEELFNAA